MARPLLRRDGLLVLWLDADAELGAEGARGAEKGLKGFSAATAMRYELPEPARRVRQLLVQRRSPS
jgi:hypothetical protein